MASPSISSAIALPFSSFTPSSLKFLSCTLSPAAVSSDRCFKTCPRKEGVPNQHRSSGIFSPGFITPVTGSFFEGGIGGEENGIGGEDNRIGGKDPPGPPRLSSILEEKEAPKCPPGLRKYESMVVLRPDMSEEERLRFTQKYEELLVSRGGMYVEVFNRGVIPLAYTIKKRNRAGEKNIYLDGIYLLFTYFTKPESIGILESTLRTDENVIRSSTFKIRVRKHM